MSNPINDLLWMKRILWSRLPFAIFKTHYFSLGMRIPATSCERFPKIFCHVESIFVFKRSWFCNLDRFSIKSEFKMNFNLQANKVNLQMTFFSIGWTKAEKYFLHFKLISAACTIFKIKFQGSNSFYIAAINSTDLNYHFNILIFLQMTNLSVFIATTNNPILSI